MILATLAGFWVDLREWLTAIGTAGAVIVAVGLTIRAERLARGRRPVLELSYDPETGISAEMMTILLPGVNAAMVPHRGAYLRFRVSNRGGVDAAVGVEVLLAAVKVPSFEAETRTVEISFPGFQWTHLDAKTRLTIAPGVTRTIDVARVIETSLVKKWQDRVELCVFPTPGNERNFLEPGTYELDLTLSARNADAARYYARIEYDPSESVTERVRVLDAPTPLKKPLPHW